MASTSVSSIKKRFKYDVFLSFRGEDTRKNFVDHLYHALHQKGIITYKDDEKIKKGERIKEQLVRSIKDSRFYIIVFSKNYAASSWCLDELVKIMECQKTKEQTAYPVFYDVEPTEVRHQSGAVGEAFVKLEKGSWSSALPLQCLFSIVASCCNGSSSSLSGLIDDLENEDDVGRWRNALKEAAGLAGMELKNNFNGHEAKFIQQIVHDVSLKLRVINPCDDGKLVGMETRVKDVVLSLEIGSDDVRMIGIKGMGGGGKTTLARAVFDHISIWFEGKSFVENVREVSKGSLSGLKELQKQVLSALLNDQIIASVSDGKSMMKKIMPSTKVLLALDDVDDIEQLEALAGELTWFKPGSRVIITTRDEQVLVAHRVKFIHDVNLLSGHEAICLFSRYAFGKEIPIQGYEELSRKVVHYAAGLPLTIKVLGSHLCGRSENEWVDAIERLKTIPLDKTLKRLEISYNGLENDQKEIFLDVVCLLKNEKKDYAIRTLESCGFNAQIGLSVLEQKSLITISNFGRLGFHDHIQEMGWNIVRCFHPNEPSRHSRLWIKEEVEDILINELGTEETKCIKLECSDVDPTIILKGLRKMKELRFIYMPYGPREWKVYEVGQYLPDALRSLCWHRYPFWSLPKTFRAKKLVNLEMCQGNISQLWEVGERKVLDKLRYLNLSWSKLKSFDLGMTPHLEELVLEGCHDFVVLHMLNECPNLKLLNLSHSKVSNLNLGMTPHIEELKLEGCSYLQEIHAPVGCLKKLLYLNLKGCSRFDYFLVDKRIVFPGQDSLAKLQLNAMSLNICPLHPNSALPKFQFRCEYDEPLPSSFGNLEKLLSFGLCSCTNLESFSATICGLQQLRELTLKGRIPEVPKDLDQIQCLEKLCFVSIEEIKQLPDSICMLKHLKSLEIDYCLLLEQLPKDLGRLECLEELHLMDCISLRDIPNSICKVKSLTYLDLSGCHQIEKLPEELGCLESLEKLDLSYCRSLRDIPNGISKTKSLRYLNLFGCHQVEKLPEELGCLEYLEKLDLKECISLRDIPNSICRMKSLTYLDLSGCHQVEKLPEELGCLEHLEMLDLSNCRSLLYIPNGISKMKSLTYLNLSGCHKINKLPEELGRLECLEKLDLKECRSLRDIPNNICKIKSLTYLNLFSCYQLEKLPEELGYLERVEKLDLSLCRSLIDIPNGLCKMKSLTYLNLTKCRQVGKLPEELGSLECLKVLNLDGAGISHLPQSVYHMKGLHIYGSKGQLESYGFTSLTEQLWNTYYVEL